MAASITDDWLPEDGTRAPTDAERATDRGQARKADRATGDAYDSGFADHQAGNPGANRPADPALGSIYDAGTADSRKAGRSGAGRSSSGRSSAGRSSAGTGPGRAAKGGAPNPSRPGVSAGKGGAAESGAGVILGMIGYALVINYLRGGYPAVRGWFGAKFINKPYTGGLAKTGPAIGVAPLATK